MLDSYFRADISQITFKSTAINPTPTALVDYRCSAFDTRLI